jgi:hypothetical protein
MPDLGRGKAHARLGIKGCKAKAPGRICPAAAKICLPISQWQKRVNLTASAFGAM